MLGTSFAAVTAQLSNLHARRTPRPSLHMPRPRVALFVYASRLPREFPAPRAGTREVDGIESFGVTQLVVR